MAYTEFDNSVFEKDAALDAGIYGINDPFRLRVQKCLQHAIEQVHIDHDPGHAGTRSLVNSVHRGREYFGKETKLPFVSMMEALDSPNLDFMIPASESKPVEYLLLVEGYIREVDMQNPTDVGHVFLAEVKRRLWSLKQEERDHSSVFRFGHKANTVEKIAWDSGTVRPQDETSATTHFWLHVILTLIEDHSNPLCEI